MCCDVANGVKPAPVYVVDDRPQLPPRFKPTYQPVHSSTIGGGGGALSAKSAALADWIAAKDASIAPAKRSFFIGSSPGSWSVTAAKRNCTVANRQTDSCDTSAT